MRLSIISKTSIRYVRQILPIIILVLFFNGPAISQITIKDSDGKVYKIRAGTRIKYQLRGDTITYSSVIKDFDENKYVILKRGKYIEASQLAYIQFKPKKIKRAIWIGGLAIMGGIGITTYWYDSKYFKGEGGVPATFIYVMSLPIAIPSLWIVSEMADLTFSKKKEIYFRDQGVSIIVHSVF